MFSVASELQSQIDQLRAGLVTEIEQLREENRRLRSEVSILLQFYRLHSVELVQAYVKPLKADRSNNTKAVPLSALKVTMVLTKSLAVPSA